REGTQRLREILVRVSQGKGEESDLGLLDDAGWMIKETSLCGLGQTAPNPVLSTLRYFRDEYEAHIREKRCPAKVCRELIVNGIEVEVEHGTTVLEAARFLGIPIPTLCHDDGLVPYGACRLCLVEVSSGKKRNLQASCCLPAEDGMVVSTHSARVERARRLLV